MPEFSRFLPMHRLLRDSEVQVLYPDFVIEQRFRRRRVSIFLDYVRLLKKAVNEVEQKRRDLANARGEFDMQLELQRAFQIRLVFLGFRMAAVSYRLRIPRAGRSVERALRSLEFNVFRAAPSTATI